MAAKENPAFDDGRIPDSHLAEHEDDPEAGQRGYIKATDFSPPYTSQWSRLHSEEAASLLRHMNCSYLSTPEQAPTLLALKQHAQALCNLILFLVPTFRIGEIDGANPPPDGSGKPDPLSTQFVQNDAFDFLTDLRTPYTNADPDHAKPLWSLLNEVASRSDAYGTVYACPLTETDPPREKSAPVRPYANHHSLAMHANACLERLDHEFAPEGGLMALLPDDGEHDEKSKRDARNSLLGQWLAFTQHLVRRQHELELAYGNALDVVAGDAVVPMQSLLAAGPDARTAGRQVVFPQDRWVLANAGDDVWGYLQGVLDRREAEWQEKERLSRGQGVARSVGDGIGRGIVHVNVQTRYYRLAGQGHSTIFVVPGWEHHPAVEATRELEQHPKVVAVPTAKYPERVTELERKYGVIREEAGREAAERSRLAAETLQVVREGMTMNAELERVEAANEALIGALGEESRDYAKAMAEMKTGKEQAERQLEKGKREYERQRYAMRGRYEELEGQFQAATKAVEELKRRELVWKTRYEELQKSEI